MRRFFRPLPLIGTVMILVPGAAACGVLGLNYALWGLLGGGLIGAVVIVAIWRLHPEFSLLEDRELARCPTPELCRCWQKSQRLLQPGSHSTRQQATVSRLRAAYLDEFERRDPEGFLLWINDYLHSVPDSPEHYIFAAKRPRP